MPVTGLAKVTENIQREWKPLPEGLYQAVIVDITEKVGKKYKSDEEQVQYLFKFAVLDEGEQKGQIVSAFSSPSWFKGYGDLSASKLVTIFKAIYAFYFPGISVLDMAASEIDQLMNENLLIGSQLNLVVKLNDDKTNNKITDFMAIKIELPLPNELEFGSEIKIKKPEHKEATNPKSSEEFIQGLEEDRKKELSGEQIAEVLNEE